MVIEIDNKEKKLRIITIMQLNKKSKKDYKFHKMPEIDLGKIPKP